MKRFLNGELFPQSEELLGIIKRSGWMLVDISDQRSSRFPKSREVSWDEIEELGPADEIRIGGTYFLVPYAKDGQTLREAYSVTRGLGPSLKIVDPDDPRWEGLELNQSDKLALFTRLAFAEEGVMAYSPVTDSLPYPDYVGMAYETLLETFERFYGVTTSATIV